MNSYDPHLYWKYHNLKSFDDFLKSYSSYRDLLIKVLDYFFNKDIVKKAVEEEDWITVFDSFNGYNNWEIWTADEGWDGAGNPFSVDILALFLYFKGIDFLPKISERYFMNDYGTIVRKH